MKSIPGYIVAAAALIAGAFACSLQALSGEEIDDARSQALATFGVHP